MTMNADIGLREKVIKKQYVKPMLEIIELRADERIATKPSDNQNCAACQGAGTGCAPSGQHGEGF